MCRKRYAQIGSRSRWSSGARDPVRVRYDLLYFPRVVFNRNPGLLSIPNLLQKLYEHNIRSVMVEGGASVIGTFMDHASQPRHQGESPIVDTLIVTVAPTLVGNSGLGYSTGVPGDGLGVSDYTVLLGMRTDSLDQAPNFMHIRTELMGKDVVIAGKFV